MQQFDALATRLLHGGVAYRHVRRYIAELRDHAEDALRAEMARGASAEEAHNAALARLGTMDDLARGMMARPELQAMAARFPKLWGGGMPVALWLGAALSITLTFVGVMSLLKAAGIVPLGGSYRLAQLQAPADAMVFIIVRALPTVIGVAMLAWGLAQRTRLLWSLAGVGVLALFAGAAEMTVHFASTPETLSSLNLGVGTSPRTALRASIMFALMLTPLLLRKRFTRFAP